MTLTLDQICEISNDSLRIYNTLIGDPLNPKWANLAEPERDVIRAYVSYIQTTNATAETSHNREIYLMALDGWRYDATYAAGQKKSPEIIPYTHLTDSQKRKDQLILNIAKTFL